jgi:hypothetical protein
LGYFSPFWRFFIFGDFSFWAIFHFGRVFYFGRFFTVRAIFYFGQFLKKQVTKFDEICGTLTCFQGKSYELVLTKMGWSILVDF